MAHRVSEGGSYRIDKTFPGVGRIAKASGATTIKGLSTRKAMLDRLYDRGRLDILRAIRRNELTITEVLDADRRNDLDGLIGGGRTLSRNLWETVDTWMPQPRPGKRRQSPHTIRRYKTAFTQLEARGILSSTATIRELAQVDWVTLEAEWGKSAADWNHLRAAVGKFLTDVLGDVHHSFRREVMKPFPKRTEVERIPDITPALFWKIVEATPEHVQASYVVLAALGLDTGEYLELTKHHLRANIHAVEAPGTKTYARHGTLYVDPRLWEWIERGIPSPVQYGWLRKHFKRAVASVAGADPGLRLKDLRHCLGQWLTDEGMSEARVQTAMRHANANMTRRYAKQRDRGEAAKLMADVLLRSA